MTVAAVEDLVLEATYHGVQYHKNGPSKEYQGVYLGARLDRTKIRKKWKEGNEALVAAGSEPKYPDPDTLQDRHGLLVDSPKFGKAIMFFDLADMTLVEGSSTDSAEEA